MHGGGAICNFHKYKYICQVFVSFTIMQVLHDKNIKYFKVFEVKYTKFTWRRAQQPTPVFSPGEFHGQRILEGYSPWSRKDLDMNEQLIYTHMLNSTAVQSWIMKTLDRCQRPDFDSASIMICQK